MIDLDKYYLGLILLNPFVYNKKRQLRYYQGVNWDPFCSMEPSYGMFVGLITILKKDEETFYDEIYSRFDKEVAYHIGETNKYGIFLAHVKNIKKCFPNFVPTIYELDELIAEDALEKMLTAPYYICKDSNEYSIVLLDEEDENVLKVREEYYQKLLKLKK